MRTISVKEAAAALGITPRAVTYRLEKGQLKGSLTKNDFGVPEWRIYPNKQILQGLNEPPSDEGPEQTSFEPNDVVDVVSVESSSPGQQSEQGQATAFPPGFQAMVEQCVRPLVEEVKAQAVELAEKDRIIEEQSRQLRLLPDLQKQAEIERKHAEEERKAAELRAMEVEALNKQIAAIEAEKEQLLAKANEASALANDLLILKNKVEDLQKPWWKKLFGSPEESTGKDG